MRYESTVAATLSFGFDADSEEEAKRIAGEICTRVQSDVCVGDNGVRFYATVVDAPHVEESQEKVGPTAWYDEATGMYKGVDNGGKIE